VTLPGPYHGGKTETIHGLVLAAGRGQRFGGGKLHAVYRGRPLLSHVLAVAEAACKRGILQGGHVVIAAGDQTARELARDFGVETLVNEEPDRGLSHSLRLGLQALEGRSEQIGAAIVLLGDQPLVRLDVIERLVAAWLAGSGPILRPRYQADPDTPGHPVLLARPIWARARQVEGDRGFGSLFDSASLELLTLDVPGGNPDVDTQADLQSLQNSHP
jgi:molybdenum cofactor cytidylyltransferase